jgi:hypothetical protein
MSEVIFDPALFRTLYPAFAADPPYTDVLLEAKWLDCTLWVTNQVNVCNTLTYNETAAALMMLLAHMLAWDVLVAANGNTGNPGVVTQATIDKVSVTQETPPGNDNWSYWLNSTPYGKKFLAFMRLKSIGGFSIGALPETAAFRRVAGVFL